MKNKKRLFILLSLIFFGAIIYVSYDISSKTTYPGSKPQLQERLMPSDDAIEKDTVLADSLEIM